MNETDIQLLERYSRQRSEEAFAELVHRHLGLVYSVAWRQLRSPELAQEVAQSVFVDLARKATQLSPKTVVPAWLYQVARRTAIDVLRGETRRQMREQIASQLTAMDTSPTEWSDLEPLLDEAMETLDETDRAAILLRYFEDKSLREVGETLGISENAAQKRLSRATDSLHRFFGKSGCGVGASGLIALISANAVQAAPAGLGAAICSAAAQTTTTTALTTTVVTAMTTLQKSVVAAGLVAAIGTGLYQAHKAKGLEQQLQELTAQLPTVAQLGAVTRERDEAMDQLTDVRTENEQLKLNNSELFRLRGEVTQLRADARAAAQAEGANTSLAVAARSWLDRVSQLKHRLQHMPDAEIPEMQLLSPEDWLAAVKQPSLATDEEYRRAFASLRNTAQSKFASIAQPALSKYLESNNWTFPTDLAQLQPYFEPDPLDPSILERYAILPAASIPNLKVGGEWVITQKSPVDAEFDQRIAIGPSGHGSGSYPREEAVTQSEIDALTPALTAFSGANNGRAPVDPAQLAPYITTPEQQIAFEKLMQERSRRHSQQPR